MVPKVLTIAGSAAQGSAGIQADLKTFQERDVYGMAAITAMVANNTITKQGIFTHSLEAVEAQYYTAAEKVGFDAVKTGMLFTKEIISLVAGLLEKGPTKKIVVDPVMIGKMGSQLLRDDAIELMKEKLIPLAWVITPNLHEAERLLECGPIDTTAAMREAAKQLYQLGPEYVLVKGGSLKESAVDVLYDGSTFTEFYQERINTIHTSGAGCSYSAAITAELAKNKPMEEAVDTAKAFVTAAIQYPLDFGRGIGSTYHAAYRKYGNEVTD
ncbi:bifunctional hydroxymethylpyrimidine kinase/phosphomethylpyrimidine kinase [Sediminibacillus albus]|uniref:Hydroxymethylpyrimidine/phosphomethylpyrimidine kinase n=1 Tax=Sediminibacillus albus TaxID=407036 RepID=A0A1G9ARX5_9BACI|nr:bifunctional hydroxymethylpyrimidine kinase/phosphomethylpyrimidine kinase [Sediminibacillus albus]SDK29380.1 pyridoxine kinase/hydroxymethylpyrimidine/phosphomethylpyrimidine kinase [Sediminibacillus albus]